MRRLGIAAALLAAACGAAPAGSEVVTLSRDVQPILTARCGGVECHAGYFGEGSSRAHLVDVAAGQCQDGRLLVKPGDPDASYLYQKLLGAGDLCAGSAMPLRAAALTSDQLATIAAWIRQGALDN